MEKKGFGEILKKARESKGLKHWMSIKYLRLTRFI